MCISSLIARRLLEGKIIQRRTGFSKGLHNNALSRSLHTDTVNTHIQFHKEINSIESPERHNQIFLLICLLAPRKQLFLMKKKKNHGQFKWSSLEKHKTYGNTGRMSDHCSLKSQFARWCSQADYHDQVGHNRSHWVSLHDQESPQMEPTQTHSGHVRKLSFPTSDLRLTCTCHELPVPLDLHALQCATLNYQVALVRTTQKLAEPYVITPWSL